MENIQLKGITPKELVELLDQRQKLRFEEFKRQLQPTTLNKYIRRKDLSKMLSVDISSIHNYTSKGILTAYQIGGVVMYKLSEVENAIVKLKK